MQVDEELNANNAIIVAFAELWLDGRAPVAGFRNGVILHYFVLLRATEMPDPIAMSYLRDIRVVGIDLASLKGARTRATLLANTDDQ